MKKKRRERDDKIITNVHVDPPVKEFGSQTTLKESIKDSMLNSDSTEINGNVNGYLIKKKKRIIQENRSI